MIGKLSIVILIALVAFGATVYFLRATEPFTTIYNWALPYAEQLGDIVAKNWQVVLTAIGGVFGTIYTVVTKRKDALAAAAAAKADNYIGSLENKIMGISKEAEEKIGSLEGQVTSLVEEKTNVTNKYLETVDKLKESSGDLTTTQTLLTTANTLNDDYRKQIDTLKARIEQLEAEKPKSYVNQP
jgi:septal ring factor EnvC (AmiA/AmiB activator)